MPIYQYRCESCGIGFERVQHFSDAPLMTCPECEGKVHRVIQPVGIIFKGSGFYVTDNRRNSALLPGKKNGGEREGEEKTPKSDASAKADSGGEAKATAAVSGDKKP